MGFDSSSTSAAWAACHMHHGIPACGVQCYRIAKTAPTQDRVGLIPCVSYFVFCRASTRTHFPPQLGPPGPLNTHHPIKASCTMQWARDPRMGGAQAAVDFTPCVRCFVFCMMCVRYFVFCTGLDTHPLSSSTRAAPTAGHVPWHTCVWCTMPPRRENPESAAPLQQRASVSLSVIMPFCMGSTDTRFPPAPGPLGTYRDRYICVYVWCTMWSRPDSRAQCWSIRSVWQNLISCALDFRPIRNTIRSICGERGSSRQCVV
jgi:hypothetical protein